MSAARRHHHATILADGSVLVTGGTLVGDELQYAVYAAERFNPVTETWTSLDSMAVPRRNGSVALLLPDARVLVAGGGSGAAGSELHADAEIFSPPYLFKGARPVITAMADSMVYGDSLTVDGQRYPLFPEPAVLSAASEVRLRELQFSRQKIDYILRLSDAVASGSLDFVALATLPPDEALRELMTLRGIGRWTAEYLLLRGFGHRDAFPAGDSGLRRAVGQWYGLGRLATEDEVRQRGAVWRRRPRRGRYSGLYPA